MILSPAIKNALPCFCNRRGEDDHDATFRELKDGYFHDGEWIDMSERIECYYHESSGPSVMKMNVRKIPIGTPIASEKTADGQASFVPMPVEMRGVTLRQLRAIKANADRRCIEEEWVDRKGNPIKPTDVNLYDINKFIIKPFTEATQTSLVEALPSTAGTQPPRFFTSHWWGESFCHSIDCITQMVRDFQYNFSDKDEKRGGGMTEDTPIWICAFANNQWKLYQAISINPMDSSFAKAMIVACFRTLSILDKNGTVFTRIWCIEEVNLTLIFAKDSSIGNDGVWAIYTAHNHFNDIHDEDRNAVGIVSGGAPYEIGLETTDREKHFPSDLILRSINIKVESAEASQESDRIHILNSIIGNEDGLKAEPPATHPKYDKLNDAVRGAFAASAPALQSALVAGDDEWNRMLDTLSKGIQTDGIKFSFEHQKYEGESAWFHLTPPKARDMISHLPITCSSLTIEFSEREMAESLLEGVVDYLNKAENLKELNFRWNHMRDAEKSQSAGTKLANVLSDSSIGEKIEHLRITESKFMTADNISDWATALKQMKSLKTLDAYSMELSEEDMEVIKEATHASDITF